MTRENLPVKVDPFRFADSATHLQGVLQVKDMSRLCGSLVSTDGQVEVRIEFGVNEQHIRFLHGHVDTSVKLQCQRCLETFSYAIISSFLLGIVKTDEEAETLPERFEPLVIKGAELILSDILEDELIVNLPLVPMHEASACKVKLPLAAKSGSELPVEKENPFKVIEFLRDKNVKN